MVEDDLWALRFLAEKTQGHDQSEKQQEEPGFNDSTGFEEQGGFGLRCAPTCLLLYGQLFFLWFTTGFSFGKGGHAIEVWVLKSAGSNNN